MEVKHLKREQKEAIALLYIGTFLEYFDLFLFIHMAGILGELFYPSANSQLGPMIPTIFFCVTFIFRPIGALFLGYIGDNLGRKPTVIISTCIMSMSCIIMASVPTYSQIGITATYIVVACRVLQGMASMVEVVGADLYLTEIIKPPLQYPMVMLVPVFGVGGAIASLGVATLVTSFDFDWRSAFILGATVALVGIVARTRLRETADFVDAKLRVKRAVKSMNRDSAALNNSKIWNEKVNRKTAFALFCIDCGWPTCFYFAFVYCPEILKETFQLSSAQIIHHNLIVSIIQFLLWLLVAYISYKVSPLKFLKARLMLFVPFILFCPYLLGHAGSPFHIMLVQILIVTLGCMGMPAKPIFYKHLPVFKRFTYASLTYAFSRAIVYPIIIFVLGFYFNLIGHGIILVIMLPVAISFFYAIRHIEQLENKGQISQEIINSQIVLT